MATTTAQVGAQARQAAFDVEEFLGAQIGAEAGFGDDEIDELERGACRHHRVAAMRDIGERPAMDERRIVFERLHQIGRERVLQQRRHRAGRFDVGGADRLAVAGLPDDDAAKAPLQIGEVGGQAKDRHDLRGDGDVEAVLAREAVGRSAQADGDLAQRAVIHVEPRRHVTRRGSMQRLVAPIDMIVDHRGEQIVGRADGMEVAGEMQVDLVHRHDLGVAAAGRAAFHAEARAEARLAQADHRRFGRCG